MPREVHSWTKYSDQWGNIYADAAAAQAAVDAWDASNPTLVFGADPVMFGDDSVVFGQSADERPVITTTVIETSTWVCRRCGRAFDRRELVNDLCVNGNKYGGQGCYDDDEDSDLDEED